MSADREHTARRRAAEPASPSAEELLEEMRRIGDDLVALGGAARHVARGWRTLLRRQLERQPYATLGAAAGVGYVLGGGLPAGVARMLLVAGGRIILNRAVAQLVDVDPDLD